MLQGQEGKPERPLATCEAPDLRHVPGEGGFWTRSELPFNGEPCERSIGLWGTAGKILQATKGSRSTRQRSIATARNDILRVCRPLNSEENQLTDARW